MDTQFVAKWNRRRFGHMTIAWNDVYENHGQRFAFALNSWAMHQETEKVSRAISSFRYVGIKGNFTQMTHVYKSAWILFTCYYKCVFTIQLSNYFWSLKQMKVMKFQRTIFASFHTRLYRHNGGSSDEA
jgi:hypothetical protein